jgi:hypothetical protein
MTMSGNLAEWAQAIATLLAVLVALFGSWLRSLCRRPRLEVTIEAATPDCIKIPIHIPALGIAVDSYYLRMKVRNNGNEVARSVEVFLESALRQQADDTYSQVSDFIPLHLHWSNVIGEPNDPYIPAISPGMYRHCDVAHIVDPSNRSTLFAENKQWPGIPPTKTILSLDTVVKPNTLSHLLPYGRYHLVLVLAAANAKPVRKTLEITATGDWQQDEQTMLRNSIGVKTL